jgi:hypothetical protein
MAEQLLHLEQAHAPLDQPGGVGVPEGVRRRSPVALDEIRCIQAGAGDRLADRVRGLTARRVLASETVNVRGRSVLQ